MAWSAIWLHGAAIATLVNPFTTSPLSQHPMVTRLSKAVFLARPISRHQLTGLATWLFYTRMSHIYSSLQILGAPMWLSVPSRIDGATSTGGGNIKTGVCPICNAEEYLGKRRESWVTFRSFYVLQSSLSSQHQSRQFDHGYLRFWS